MFPKRIKAPKKKDLKEKKNNNIKTKNFNEDVKDMTFQGENKKIQKRGKNDEEKKV